MYEVGSTLKREICVSVGSSIQSKIPLPHQDCVSPVRHLRRELPQSKRAIERTVLGVIASTFYICQFEKEPLPERTDEEEIWKDKRGQIEGQSLDEGRIE